MTCDLEWRSLAALSGAELQALGELPVTPAQAVFGKSFGESLADWRAAQGVGCIGFCLYRGGVPVGLVLFKRGGVAADWVPPEAASMHGLKIARPWQGRGLGHLAFRAALDGLRDVWPDIARLVLAVDAGNAAALAVYRRAGMVDFGPLRRGRNGAEYRLTLPL